MPLGALGVGFLLVGLLASVALHELGHFVTARHFGAKVTEFMVGFGPRLWSVRRGETTYGVRAVPLGGYVRILGMIPPVGTGGGEVASSAREHSRKEAEGLGDRAFWRLAPWKRMVVMAAGPFMNLAIWAVLTLIVLLVLGVPGVSREVASVSPCVPPASAQGSAPSTACSPADGASPAALAGLQPGDTIVRVNGAAVDSWEQASAAFRNLEPGAPAQIGVLRDGSEVSLNVTPVASPIVPGAAYIGVSAAPDLLRLTPLEATSAMGGQLVQAGGAVVTFPVRILDTISRSVAGQERDPEGPIGLVGMGRIGGEVAAADFLPASFRWVQLLLLLAGLNLALFIFNMVPLLPLDGGHVAAAAWEGMRRRIASVRGKPDPGPVDVARALPFAYAVGIMFIAATLMLVVVDLVNPIRLLG